MKTQTDQSALVSFLVRNWKAKEMTKEEEDRVLRKFCSKCKRTRKDCACKER